METKIEKPKKKTLEKVKKNDVEVNPPFPRDTSPEQLSKKKLAEALLDKADYHGIDLDLIVECFIRGCESLPEDSSVTPVQWGFARVNSFISGGLARKQYDADLWESVEVDDEVDAIIVEATEGKIRINSKTPNRTLGQLCRRKDAIGREARAERARRQSHYRVSIRDAAKHLEGGLQGKKIKDLEHVVKALRRASPRTVKIAFNRADEQARAKAVEAKAVQRALVKQSEEQMKSIARTMQAYDPSKKPEVASPIAIAQAAETIQTLRQERNSSVMPSTADIANAIKKQADDEYALGQARRHAEMLRKSTAKADWDIKHNRGGYEVGTYERANRIGMGPKVNKILSVAKSLFGKKK